VPAAKAAVEQRRQDANRPAAMDVGDEQSDSDSEMEGGGDEHQAAEAGDSARRGGGQARGRTGR
jgi:hypothetical protein